MMAGMSSILSQGLLGVFTITDIGVDFDEVMTAAVTAFSLIVVACLGVWVGYLLLRKGKGALSRSLGKA